MSRLLRTTLLTTSLLLVAGSLAQPAAAAPVPAVASPVVASASAAGSAAAPVVAVATKYKNCAALNAAHPHGVAKAGAADVVRGKTKPVTTFKVAPKIYAANTHLDRDKDGVACEKR